MEQDESFDSEDLEQDEDEDSIHPRQNDQSITKETSVASKRAKDVRMQELM